jgi:hypothetical protein
MDDRNNIMAISSNMAFVPVTLQRKGESINWERRTSVLGK